MTYRFPRSPREWLERARRRGSGSRGRGAKSSSAPTTCAIVASTERVGLPEPTNAGQLLVFLMPIFIFALSLPPAVLAWTIPDPDPEPIYGSGSREEPGR